MELTTLEYFMIHLGLLVLFTFHFYYLYKFKQLEEKLK